MKHWTETYERRYGWQRVLDRLRTRIYWDPYEEEYLVVWPNEEYLEGISFPLSRDIPYFAYDLLDGRLDNGGNLLSGIVIYDEDHAARVREMAKAALVMEAL